MQIEKILHPVQYGLKVLPEPPTITKAQTGIIFNRGKAIAGGSGKIRAELWSRFQNHFGLSSYKDLPADRFDEAIAYLNAKQEEYTQGVEMLWISRTELNEQIAEQLKALPAPKPLEGEILAPSPINSVTLNFGERDKPTKTLIEQGSLGYIDIRELSPTALAGELVQVVTELRGRGYILFKKDDVSAFKLANDYLPYTMLAPLIEAAAQRLQRIENSKQLTA